MKLSLRRPLPHHLEVPWGVKDALVVFLGAWIALPALTIVLLRVTASFDPFAAAFIKGLQDGEIMTSFALAIIDGVGALALVMLYLRRYKAGWPAIGWRRFNPVRAIAYLLAIFIVFAVVINMVLWFVSLIDPSFQANEPQQNDFLASASSHPLIALVALVVIPPIIEETVFRGFIFPALSKRWGLILGAVGSSVLFGLAHLQANVSIYTFLLGLLLCFMYTRLKSIVPGIALHMLNNYLAFVALTTK